MAVTTQNSTQYANEIADPVVLGNPYDKHGKIRVAYFDFTQSGAGDANSLVNLVKLPGGRVRVLLSLSMIRNSDFGAGRTLDVGWTAYTGRDGSSVAADIDGLADGLDVNNTTEKAMGTGAGALVTVRDFDSQEGVVIQAKVLGDTIPDAATLRGYIVYCVE